MATRAPPTGNLDVQLGLPGQPRSASAARAFLRGALTGRLPDDILDTAELLVSELITNAVRHTGANLTVDIANSPNLLRVAVTDGDAHSRPRRNAAALDDERGRGLSLIEALAHNWGVLAVPGGKQVWCELTL